MPPKLDLENTWVVSDTHFGHDNIVGFCHRPIDHEAVMLAEWRAAVPDHATVLHLGDLCWKSNAHFKHIVAPELTGARKYLILGNHDKQRRSFYRDCGFRVIDPFVTEPMPGHGYRASFDHYPLSAPPQSRNVVHVHGHIHNNGYGGKATDFTPFAEGQINVSVEQTKYRPVNLKRLLDGYLGGCYEPEGGAA